MFLSADIATSDPNKNDRKSKSISAFVGEMPSNLRDGHHHSVSIYHFKFLFQKFCYSERQSLAQFVNSLYFFFTQFVREFGTVHVNYHPKILVK